MQSVDYIHGWWVLRAAGRNPLVRGSDRLELLIVTVGILFVVVGAACAGALGTAVHDARSRVYIAQAQTRHTVVAEAIELTRGARVARIKVRRPENGHQTMRLTALRQRTGRVFYRHGAH